MVKTVEIYFEGGGPKDADTKFRQAFAAFLAEFRNVLQERGGALRVICCGTRRLAYDKFCHALELKQADTLTLLLVDSESEVKNFGECWKHLKERVGDDWERPKGAEEWHCHLMAQAMEAWFFADIDAVTKFYNDAKFHQNALPKTQDVEEIPKSEHLTALNAATKDTTKKRYHKIQHGPKILETLDSAKVRRRAPHCERLFAVLAEKINAADDALAGESGE